MRDKFAEYKEKFCDAISNDLNTSMAITIVYDLLKDDTLNDATKRALAEDFDRVLSLNLTTAKVENRRKTQRWMQSLRHIF